MGKIKSKQIKKVANFLVEKGVNFNGDFESNKRILGTSMPSKKLRNQLSGFISKKKKNEKPLIAKTSEKKE